MSMLAYNEIRENKTIVRDGEPWLVLASHVFRKQQRKPVNQTKLKSLISGKVVEISFGQSEKAEEADLAKKNVVFIYAAKGEYWFHEEGDKSARFSLSEEVIGNLGKYLKQNTDVQALVFDEKIIGLSLPIKMDFKVTEAPPNMRGDTSSGGNKVVTLETGATVNVPLFINEGDILKINTETGEYVERVSKA